MIHFIAKGISDISKSLEEDLFRIEKENHLAASLLNGAIAGIAVVIVAWMVTSIEGFSYEEGDLLLFACLGSSAASIVFTPISRSNSLRSILIAYGISAFICVILTPIRTSGYFSIPIQCGLAVTLSISLMRLLDAMHPAAVGSAMAFIIYNRNLATIVFLLFAILGLLLVVKILVYAYREELTFRHFPKEFKRSYYGSEMMVTLEQNESAQDTPQSGTIKNMIENKD